MPGWSVGFHFDGRCEFLFRHQAWHDCLPRRSKKRFANSKRKRKGKKTYRGNFTNKYHNTQSQCNCGCNGLNRHQHKATINNVRERSGG